MTKFEQWKESFGIKLKHEKWYEKGTEISGVSADNLVMMVGTVVFEFSHEGRSLDLEFGVLKGGDSGSADVIVGNYVLRSDRYDGAVDVGAGVVTLRKVDSRGVMKISVTTELVGLASMLAAHMARTRRRANLNVTRARGCVRGQVSNFSSNRNAANLFLLHNSP